MIDNPDLDLSFLDLKDVIAEERIIVEFQSILSARNHSIIGFEGLIRGKSLEGSLIPPIVLFDAARKYGMILELDRLCREKVLSGFKNIYRFQKNHLLFLNLETSFLSSTVVGSGYLFDQVARHNIPPTNIVIEIVESKTIDSTFLIHFMTSYRESGFNIALDDVGSGHSNFDRISLLKPDIIKVDRSIISGMATNYFKKEIFRSLSNLSKNIGCLTLAEGVKTQEEEVLCCFEYGADLLQGYFFSRPKDVKRQISYEEEQIMEELLAEFRMKHIRFVKARRMQNQRYQKTVQIIIKRIRGKSLEDIDSLLPAFVDIFDSIDALYIVNYEGIQITDTIMKRGEYQRNPVFRATGKNENLLHKDYIYQLIYTDLAKYSTDRYISFATGNLCVRLSYLFRDKGNNLCILCTDFLAVCRI